MTANKYKTHLLLALKLALGSCIAITIAEAMQLDHATTAGSIALLTIMGTRWETIHLSLLRIATFFLTATMMGVTLSLFHNEVIAYGLFIFLLVFSSHQMGWVSAISVNAVIATHFMSEDNFTLHSVINEFWLIVIGISVALVINFFNQNYKRRQTITKYMRHTEEKLQNFLRKLADSLEYPAVHTDIWTDLLSLEHELESFVTESLLYQGNTLQSHSEYYANYFQMRLLQCHLLCGLQEQLTRIREMPRQAQIISEYLSYLADYLIEANVPTMQMKKLEELFSIMQKEPLPGTREEFESRALLYHVLMDLEKFLNYKTDFVEHMDEKQKEIYWKQHQTREF